MTNSGRAPTQTPQPRTGRPDAAPGDSQPALIRGRSILPPVDSSPRRADLPSPGPNAELAFRAIDPATGGHLPTQFICATPAEIDHACWQAWEAYGVLLDRPAADRARLLETIADKLAQVGDTVVAVASDETGLGPARLVSERERTLSTLRMFAALVRRGDWVRAVIDTGHPSRRPLPKPDVRRMLRPLGPVGVFGASNFPMAYSTAGGDTASALAAGCPVVVKGHPAHPGTGELVARLVAEAVEEVGLHPGVFSFLHAGGRNELAVGERVVQHAAVRAVGFTGSLKGGTALARLAAQRPDPIPVFAEMGSTNPVFVLPGALEAQADAIADRLVASTLSSNGQMCTCPGLIFAMRGGGAEALLKAMASAMNQAVPQVMLNHRVRASFALRISEVMGAEGVELRGGSPQAAHRSQRDAATAEAGAGVRASPAIFRTTFETFRRTPTLHEEVFGPAAIVVVCDGERELVEAAGSIQGSLTGSIWAGGPDGPLARGIQGVLEQRVGRLVFNGVPTGVEVCGAMVHGGPFPATNRPESTSVGPYAVERWCRPVCYQSVPDAFLPPELRNANPLAIRRLVNGEWTGEPIRPKKAEA